MDFEFTQWAGKMTFKTFSIVSCLIAFFISIMTKKLEPNITVLRLESYDMLQPAVE